jgi:hypothetical protein
VLQRNVAKKNKNKAMATTPSPSLLRYSTAKKKKR